jgi:hypothetical protein
MFIKNEYGASCSLHEYNDNIYKTKTNMIEQYYRRDVLENMLNNTHLTGKELFDIIMSDNNTSPTDSRRGDLYETLCEILIILKCIENINYTNIMDGDVSSLKEVKNIKTLLSYKIHKGNNSSDISIKNDNIIICFSVKYNKAKISKKKTDINDLNSEIQKHTNIYKIGLFVKSKEEIRNSIKNDIHKNLFDKIIENDLLFDEIDIIKALNVFCQRINEERRREELQNVKQEVRELETLDVSEIKETLKLVQKEIEDKIGFSVPIQMLEIKDDNDFVETLTDSYSLLTPQEVEKIVSIRKNVNKKEMGQRGRMFSNCNDFIDFINSDYLLSPRQQLTLKLHQKMTISKLLYNINRYNTYCIAHKPRSGKSITMLLICKYLLEHGYKKILIMTSVPATINSFINDLEKYIDFKNINYKLQEEFDIIDDTFNGIVFCSTEYLKTKKTKKIKSLRNINFETIFIDESHLGGSTNKTKTDIIEVDSDVEKIRKNIKLNIFVSGTANKTKQYYNIHPSCIYEWEIEDEGYMKQLAKSTEKNKQIIIDRMCYRHGDIFYHCLNDETLNKDYSKSPTQVLMKHSIDDNLIKEIDNYNSIHGTNFGYNCSSLFALKQIINENGEKEYIEKFELCETTYGIDILKEFLDNIISPNRMKNTMMKEIEKTQSYYDSRKSTIENPLLFIIYLPTHTRNNTISKLQKTLKQFLETYKLWSDYNIEYSNSIEDTGNVKEEYNEYIQSIMNRTKKENKKGCILLLGNKGSVGITYKECDVTISLDDGHNLDNQKQRFSRALTEADGKTIGINIDMNIQRTYSYLYDIIQKYRRNTKTTETNAQILYYLFKHNIFLFDPQYINNGNIKTIEITNYYEKEVKHIMESIDDTYLLENICCDDNMRDIIISNYQTNTKKFQTINKDLEGEQQNCPKGDKTKIQIDAPNSIDNRENENKIKEEEETVMIEILINKTLEMCKNFLFPLLALISKSYHIYDFKDIFINEKTESLIFSLLQDKIDLNYKNIIIKCMNIILDNNEQIVNDIREIYSTASSDKLRKLIAKHFIPTNDEKKQNAEIPTPVELVDEMLNTIPIDFWETPKKVFEPCCGKGNFVLGIFDKFYKGLENMYPGEEKRCCVIMECIYYADINSLNIFITTELLKCHIQSYCGLDDFDDFEFNNYVGNTLELDIKEKWGLEGFDAGIGNPPYNAKGNTATGNTIWQNFTKKMLNEWLIPNSYLLFVHPPGWRKPNTERGKFTKMFDLMTKQNQMLYLEIHGIKDGKKVFNCGTKYDWYLIEKTNQYKNTIIVDEDGKQNEINLSKLSWLPNSNIEFINNLINKKDKCKILCDFSYSRLDKKIVSINKDNEFKYSLIYLTPKAGIRYMYSKVNDRGHFGVPKVIIGETGIDNAINDYEGNYGMTQDSFGIIIKDKQEGENILKTIKTPQFINLIKSSCSWSNFRIDYRLFKDFNEDFWKEFI